MRDRQLLLVVSHLRDINTCYNAPTLANEIVRYIGSKRQPYNIEFITANVTVDQIPMKNK